MPPMPRRPALRRPCALLAVGLALAACGADGGTAPAGSTETVVETVTVRADGSPFHPTADTAWPAGSPFSAGGAQQIMAGLGPAVGQAAPRVRSVAFYGTYVAVTVLDPERPRQSDIWAWRDDVWSGPNPQSNEDAATLAAAAFTADPARFAVVPLIVEQMARLTSDIEDAELSYIGLDRSSRYDGRLVWRAYAGGPRESASFDFALDGTRMPEP